ncbi:MAG TPA: HD-GYP domain-containing protein [Bacilli bacterium]
MRVHISEVRTGDRLKQNVFNKYGLHVLSCDKVLDEDDIVKLQRHNIDFVEIMHRAHRGSDQQKNAKVTNIVENILPNYDFAIDKMEQLFRRALEEGKIDEKEADSAFAPLVQSFRKESDVVSLLLTLQGADEYTLHHSVQVGMISYYLAKWLGYREQEALLIGKSGYLHDIGKAFIDPKIIQKPTKLSAQEFAAVKDHTILGYDIIKVSGLPEPVALVALEHHERLDGKGYPKGLNGSEMHPYSKIVAVADVYSAMISSRSYRKKKDLLLVLKELHKLSFTELDPQVTQTFIRHMIPNFIGKKVALKNGATGVIILTNPSDFFRPLIQIGDEFIDLSKNLQLEIETVYL